MLITNTDRDSLTADLRAAETDLDTAQATHQAVPARLPLGQVNPGQQILDVQTKLISHAIRMTAFNTATALARDVRVHTGYARANHEAHTLTRQALTTSGDIDPHDGVLTVRLDPCRPGGLPPLSRSCVNTSPPPKPATPAPNSSCATRSKPTPDQRRNDDAMSGVLVTAVITMRDHPGGTEHTATATHRDRADRDRHEELGFHDGWGTVTRQLAESRARTGAAAGAEGR